MTPDIERVAAEIRTAAAEHILPFFESLESSQIEEKGPGDLVTEVRFERCPAGWQASFELHDPSVDDLAICHRLVAPTLRDARVAVPQAIGFLLGYPVEDAR